MINDWSVKRSGSLFKENCHHRQAENIFFFNIKIFKNGLVDIDILKKCRCIENQYSYRYIEQPYADLKRGGRDTAVQVGQFIL